ncbi:hypothetical protein CLAIMM_07380 [Cladophialophora immunda]|nr:hypothetical protein CLAIMM_07380 [Cladophialophora immunda]
MPQNTLVRWPSGYGASFRYTWSSRFEWYISEYLWVKSLVGSSPTLINRMLLFFGFSFHGTGRRGGWKAGMVADEGRYRPGGNGGLALEHRELSPFTFAGTGRDLVF